jgi:uridine kinase
VASLARGESIERPLYDFSNYIRVSHQTVTVRPTAMVRVEGLFALYYPELLPLHQFAIYVDTPDDLCFERRMRPDRSEHGRTAESVRLQYEATERPSSIAICGRRR